MIYLLEDDENIRKLIRFALEEEGYQVSEASAPEGFFAALSSQLPELILLDIMLPGEDGLSILRKIKADPITASIPVILVTALTGDKNTAKGLYSGADDYLTKPFSILELTARVHAVLRRFQTDPSVSHVFTPGNLYVDTSRHIIRYGDTDIILSLKEYYVLVLLLEAQGRVCTREMLLEKIWGADYGESRTLDVHIRRLRIKLESSGVRITTVKGIGYKLEEI